MVVWLCVGKNITIKGKDWTFESEQPSKARQTWVKRLDWHLQLVTHSRLLYLWIYTEVFNEHMYPPLSNDLIVSSFECMSWDMLSELKVPIKSFDSSLTRFRWLFWYESSWSKRLSAKLLETLISLQWAHVESRYVRNHRVYLYIKTLDWDRKWDLWRWH